jgi:hypothetical protein
MSDSTSKRLIQPFERELRQLDAVRLDRTLADRSPRVSQELDQQVVEFASEIRSIGSTPEQMLVELKTLLSSVAPEVPGSQRNVLVSTVTGRAIDAFYGR